MQTVLLSVDVCGFAGVHVGRSWGQPLVQASVEGGGQSNILPMMA